MKSVRVTIGRPIASAHHSDANGTTAIRNDLDTDPVNKQMQPISYSDMNRRICGIKPL